MTSARQFGENGSRHVHSFSKFERTGSGLNDSSFVLLFAHPMSEKIALAKTWTTQTAQSLAVLSPVGRTVKFGRIVRRCTVDGMQAEAAETSTPVTHVLPYTRVRAKPKAVNLCVGQGRSAFRQRSTALLLLACAYRCLGCLLVFLPLACLLATRSALPTLMGGEVLSLLSLLQATTASCSSIKCSMFFRPRR